MKDTHTHRERERERERQRHRQREKQAPCREPDVGLNPRTPGSYPEPKADAQPLSDPGAQGFGILLRLQMMREKHPVRLPPVPVTKFLPSSSKATSPLCCVRTG